ncbi:hypothetical protein MBLNU230_g7290t1 [Neophaeotheca triangularis]
MATDEQDGAPLLPTPSFKPFNPPTQPDQHESAPSSPTATPDDTIFPFPTFATSRPDARKTHFPQCIAHRGYKAAYPENTMSAFRGAMKIGAHAIETDLHITSDDIIVISHDPTLQRCYGRPDKIPDSTWSSLSTAKTLQPPHDPLPRLTDLLTLLSSPENHHIWLLLDIKISNDPVRIMSLLAKTFATHPTPSNSPPWPSRILLGLWAAKYLPPAHSYLPNYSVTHIGFALTYAAHFLDLPHIAFNLFLPMLIAPGGTKFIREARTLHHRPVLAWTVNEIDKMSWCVRHGIDGVVTDEPEVFLGLVRGWEEAERHASSSSSSSSRSLGHGWAGGLLPIEPRGYWRCLKVWLWFRVLGFWSLRNLKPVASRGLVFGGVEGEEGGAGGRGGLERNSGFGLKSVEGIKGVDGALEGELGGVGERVEVEAAT